MAGFFKSLIAIFFPWLTLLFHDNPGGAIVALFMQASLFGWPFASAWALRVQREASSNKGSDEPSETTASEE